MRALVISGGGSKGAFAGGVAQYLIQELKYDYDLYIGTSTGSLLISHLALKKIDKIKDVYTHVNQKSIFSDSPFVIKTDKRGDKEISINHWNIAKRFLKGKKTFGESKNLLKLIKETLTIEEFEDLKTSHKDIVITVSNLSSHETQYKSIKDFSYDDFCDWIWISCNYVPFMSIVYKEGCEWADGGFGSMVPIKEAIDRGATNVDVIVLETEVNYLNNLPSKNAFSLLTNLHGFMMDRIEKQNIAIGKFTASNKNAIINLYYTPTVLTTNSLVFNKHKMTKWWESGFNYAAQKYMDQNEIKPHED
ncbi:Patatin-like phospholipase [Nonlabens sp. Hel1_33_55]|uniref:patatin-like phospholipase family protein n=1 Tax=Nonlabens sp. Hel1_33_55 TaxID=1336802 RepID=UPI000875E1C3|nr:patatin-like phospholipase family protein [Nonlabens sp. Hel1_33_55]SCY14215.1 Patatin-like phospholipase [Nonlabens sp. Hel1_33_55]